MTHIGLGRRNRNAEMQHEHRALPDALQRNDGVAAARIAEGRVGASLDRVLFGFMSSLAVLNQPIRRPT